MKITDTQVAFIWTTYDVQEIRADLSASQCMEVLNYIERNYDANEGVNWFVLREACETLFKKESN